MNNAQIEQLIKKILIAKPPLLQKYINMNHEMKDLKNTVMRFIDIIIKGNTVFGKNILNDTSFIKNNRNSKHYLQVLLKYINEIVIPFINATNDSNFSKINFCNKLKFTKKSNKVINKELIDRIFLIYNYFGIEFLESHQIKVLDINEYNNYKQIHKIKYFNNINIKIKNIIKDYAEKIKRYISLSKKIKKLLFEENKMIENTDITKNKMIKNTDIKKDDDIIFDMYSEESIIDSIIIT